jgi:hypothetical protein
MWGEILGREIVRRRMLEGEFGEGEGCGKKNVKYSDSKRKTKLEIDVMKHKNVLIVQNIFQI